VLLFLQAGARWIVILYVWRRFFRWWRGRSPSGHRGGAGGRSREYLDFMASDAWRRQRGRVLRRDRHRCQQGGGCWGELHVHHQWYGEPLAATPDWACVTLCERHHDEAHGRWA
jgi:hypothetical protein